MKKTKRWAMLMALATPTLFGLNCTTDFRDAVLAGAIDYVTGTTTEVLMTAVPVSSAFAQDE